MLALLIGVSVVGTGLLIDWALDDDDSDDETQQAENLTDVPLVGEGVDYIGTDDAERVLGTSGSDSIDGSGGNDILNGMVSGDLLFGGEGNDTVYGGGGNDEIGTGAGNDRLFGEDGDDLIADEIDVANSGNDFMRGGDGDDTLVSDDGSDEMRGDLGADVLVAVEGDANETSPDVLIGGYGRDLLIGDEGDTLTGGEGVDAFAVFYPSTEAGPATITDFDPATETLALEADGMFGSAPTVTFTETGDGTGTVISVDDVAFAVVNNTSPDQLTLGENVELFGV